MEKTADARKGYTSIPFMHDTLPFQGGEWLLLPKAAYNMAQVAIFSGILLF